MGKIPVGATIARAYNFAFVQFVTLLKLSWLPLALMMGAFFAMLPMLTRIFQTAAGQLPAGSAPSFALIGLLYVVILVLILVQVIAIARYPLGLDPNPGWINFPLGKSVLRLIAAVILLMLISIGMGIGAGIVMGIVTVIVGAATKSLATVLLTGVLVFVIYLAIIYVAVRIGFLLVPVVVAESRIGIGRAWQLGRGNFWRMFVVMLGSILPFIVAEFVLIKLIMPGVPLVPTGATPAQSQAAIMAWEADMFGHLGALWYLMPVFGIFGLLFYGVMIGAQCHAYRALVPLEADAEAFN